MKRIILTISFLVLFFLCYSQWEWQNPLPQGDGLRSICFTDMNTGYALSGGGGIVKTMDAGNTWNVSSCGHNLMKDLCFTSQETGYAVGYSGTILKTTDGGNSWLLLLTGSSSGLLSIYFVDENVGYATGMTGTILKTINGGVNWTNRQAELFTI